jgi:hypothetical protein
MMKFLGFAASFTFSSAALGGTKRIRSANQHLRQNSKFHFNLLDLAEESPKSIEEFHGAPRGRRFKQLQTVGHELIFML